MILSQLLAGSKALPTTDKLAFAVLKRLSIVEAMNRLNFEYSPRHAEQSDPCILEILMAVDQLVPLIRTAHQVRSVSINYRRNQQ